MNILKFLLMIPVHLIKFFLAILFNTEVSDSVEYVESNKLSQKPLGDNGELIWVREEANNK